MRKTLDTLPRKRTRRHSRETKACFWRNLMLQYLREKNHSDNLHNRCSRRAVVRRVRTVDVHSRRCGAYTRARRSRHYVHLPAYPVYIVAV